MSGRRDAAMVEDATIRPDRGGLMLTDTITTLAATAATAADKGPWDGDGPAFWPIFPILWILVIAAVIVTAVRFRRRHDAAAPSRAGEARLAEMFAAGEVSEEDYRTRRAVLREKG
jgi:putative membrane protein